MSLSNWPAHRPDGRPFTATATPSTVVIAVSADEVNAEDAMIDNPGPYDVFVRFGMSDVSAATANSVRTPAGSLQPWGKGAGRTHASIYCPQGSQAIVIHTASGAQ